MLSSSKPDKGEAKFAARIDVLTERLDTLASTVATTASGIAKKDGEIAALRKELDARDERLADFITKTREAAGGSELRELREAVAVLAKERSKGGSGNSKQLDDLAAKVGLLGQRLETLSSTVSTTASGLAGREGELAAIRKHLEAKGPTTETAALVTSPDPALLQRVGDLTNEVSGTKLQLDTLGTELAALRVLVEQRAAEPQRPSEEIREMLVALRAKVEELAGFRAGVTEEQLEQRVAQADEGVARVSQRVDELATSIDSAVSSLADKEHELAALHRHFTESSTRIESVVQDIRDALSAFSELGPPNERDLTTLVEQLVSRVERAETAAREASAAREQNVGDVASRIDLVEQRLAAVATEVARAKTLWPVALRSLEARLDDVANHARHPDASPVPPSAAGAEGEATAVDDDLLAGLRDSLQAMETVAAEMARASDVLAPSDETGDTQPAAQEAPEDEPVPHQAVAAGGATIVPLRTSDP